MNVRWFVGIIFVMLLTTCSGMGAKQESELLENGYKAMTNGEYSTAEYLFNQALSINDKNPYTLLNLGVVYQETQRYDEARKLYQSVIDLNPSQTAVASNVEGYAGEKLADLAKINLENLPPPKDADENAQDQDQTDTDADGVPDRLDQCDGTPSNVQVGQNGCWVLTGIFSTGKTDIGPEAHEQLKKVTTILSEYPLLRLEIQGHTDNIGDAAANKRLSEKRAQSVMEYLVGHGTEKERLQWVGYGQTRPIASNDTAEGRKENRRVELKPLP